jgi:exodeoxyribonuclease-3
MLYITPNIKMKIISFNVNGLRAIVQKDKSGKRDTKHENVLVSLVKEQDPDILCLQEIKCNHDTAIDLSPLTTIYTSITRHCSIVKKGYSGVAIFSKVPPLKTWTLPDDGEGRVLIAEFMTHHVICVYTPNSKPDLSRLDYRVNTWDKMFKDLVASLDKVKPVVVAGDLNVAHQDIDLHNPRASKGAHGFTIEERAAFTNLLKDVNLVDTYRALHPTISAYSWFSPFVKTRHHGWRIDYILVSQRLSHNVKDAQIHAEYYGSDHVPISATIHGI